MQRHLGALATALLFALSLSSVAAAKTTKEAICHYDAVTDSFELLMVSENGQAIAQHLAHGDAFPGDPVPTMRGFSFDETCVAVADETIFAVAWTNVDGLPGFDEAEGDVLIAKLIDGNGNLVPDAGDIVVASRYPTGIDFGASGFGQFLAASHTAVGVFSSANGMLVRDAFGNEYRWGLRDPNSGVELDSYRELTSGGLGPDSAFVDWHDLAAPSNEGLNVQVGSPSEPDEGAFDSRPVDPADDAFIDVEVAPPPS